MESTTFDKAFFDTVTDRRNTGAIKYDSKIDSVDNDNLLQMWIADMDFKVAPVITDALINTSKHSIFGYTNTDTEYYTTFCNWYKKRMGWEIDPKWNIEVPGVMFGIAGAINALTNKGDSILICQPVYYPFANVVISNERELVISNLSFNNGRYEFDFDDIKAKIKEHNVKMFLLCSPHNPIGRVWTKEELLRIGQICLENDVYIVSDEIHSDIILKGNKHTPIASLSKELAKKTITCTSPTKTFNLAGLQAANIIISDSDTFKKVKNACRKTYYSCLNPMIIAASKAAYSKGEAWLEALLSYLNENVEILKEAFPDTAKISLIHPEGTYLMWLDCRKLALSDEELNDFFIKKAGVRLNLGASFGTGGSGFMRMNIACPKSVLLNAINRINSALKEME